MSFFTSPFRRLGKREDSVVEVKAIAVSSPIEAFLKKWEASPMNSHRRTSSEAQRNAKAITKF